MSDDTPIRTLVIDDSAFSRQAITRMLEASPLVKVVGVARDGEEALRKTFELQPDLITVDLEMPKMDGFTFLRVVMAKRPTPVIVISGRSGEDDVFKALELGAVDFVAKPTPHATPMLSSIAQELLRKVHSIRALRIEKVRERMRALPPLVARHEVGASAERGRDRILDGRPGGADADLRRVHERSAVRVPRRPAHAEGLHARLRRAARPAHRAARQRGAGRRASVGGDDPAGAGRPPSRDRVDGGSTRHARVANTSATATRRRSTGCSRAPRRRTARTSSASC
jgi:chemotaxis response regulator CheB